MPHFKITNERVTLHLEKFQNFKFLNFENFNILRQHYERVIFKPSECRCSETNFTDLRRELIEGQTQGQRVKVIV